MVWISLPPGCVSDYNSLRPNRFLISLTKKQGGDGYGTLELICMQNKHSRFIHQLYLLFQGKLALRRRFLVRGHLADFSRPPVLKKHKNGVSFSHAHWGVGRNLCPAHLWTLGEAGLLFRPC